MVDWVFATLRDYVEIAIFLTLGLGFWFGRLKFGSFSLGVVTSTLLAGILIGQIGIEISPHVKSTFFLMFLFAVGYAVGPQFFRGLKGDGVQQVIFAVCLCVVVLATAVVIGKMLGYNVGTTAGLLSGASTISAVLGVATDSINQVLRVAFSTSSNVWPDAWRSPLSDTCRQGADKPACRPACRGCPTVPCPRR